MSQAATERLTEILMAAALSRGVCTVAELGIADLIEPGSPVAVGDLAQKVGAHERSLYRILRHLASHGIFRETDDRRFDHTDLSQALRSDVEGSFRAAGRMFHRLFPAWDGLHHVVTTGGSGFQKTFGQPVFDYIGANPELGPIVDAGMTSVHGHETAAMLEAYDFSGIQVLADIGGGNGSLIGAILGRYPDMKGILFDLGHVSGRARESLTSSGVADRCTVLEGSFFESVPDGADAYLLRHIIHDWTDEQSVQILGNCRRVMPDHGRVLVVEAVIPVGNEPSLAKEYDITMMALPDGMERTEEEYVRLFESAGFRLASVTPTSSMVSIVEGRPV